jgi:photosystem II stability/assembly factor-like uncharacterized protein
MKKKIKNKNIPNINILFFGVLAVVAFASLYLAYLSPTVLLSPDSESAMPLAAAKALLSAFPPEGIGWYCGDRETYTDAQGNTYGRTELEELRKILGNDFDLELEFC